MTFSKSGLRIKQVLRWLGMASSLLFVFACLLPTKPKVKNPIDDSWMEALHSAFLNHLQFGRDIIYSYGPWGFLFGGYRPETHFLSSVIWVALGIVFWGAGRRLALGAFQNEFARWLWLMAIASLTAIVAFPNTDARLMCFPLFLIALHFFDENKFAKFIQTAVIISLGLLSLVKFTVFILSIVVVAAVTVDILWRRRRFPWSAVLYGGSVLLFWLLAGQHLSSFGPYVRNSFQIASGYTEAMARGHAGEDAYIGWFALLAFISVGVPAFAAWKRLNLFCLLPLGAVGFIVFVVFKHGFVRDDLHQTMASVLLLLITLVCFTISWPIIRAHKWWLWATAGYLPIAATYVFAAFSFHRFEEPPMTKRLAGTLSPAKWLAPIQLLYDGGKWREARERYLASYRKTYPIPPLKGTIDTYFSNPMPLFAYGLPYRPRPVFQSFCAYTPDLARLNADYLRSDKAPDTIVFDGKPIDQRYTSLEDGASWPELLTRYDLQEVELSLVVLKRSATPRKFSLTLLQEASIKFGEQLSLSTNSGPLWVEVETDRTVTGSLTSALFKPPELAINTTLRDGRRNTDHFIPEMARSGFVLSPYITDSDSFVALASDHAQSGSPDEVAAFDIAPVNESLITCYKNSLRVRVYRLDFPRQDLKQVAGYNRLAELKESLSHAALTGPGRLVYLRNAGSALTTSAKTAVLFNPPKNATRLKIGFGLYSEGGEQNLGGVTFFVCALNAVQQVTPLWSRHIDPRVTPGDRGNQEASVDLGNLQNQRILLGIMPDPGGTNETLSPYWTEMHFE